MLSVIVLCGFAETVRADTIVRTLVPLVGASVRGLVRDVILAGPPDAELGIIAEHAGCAAFEIATEAGALREAIAAARSADLMILIAGHVPQAGFFEEIEDLLNARGSEDRSGRALKMAPVTFYERICPALAPVVGMIASQSRCAKIKIESFQQLRRAVDARKPLRGRLQPIT